NCTWMPTRSSGIACKKKKPEKDADILCAACTGTDDFQNNKVAQRMLRHFCCGRRCLYVFDEYRLE
ncbi:MAG: hypothetical protein IKJ54_01970, partial [Anaerotignum sp.]|nr:hypothetical protein [Anaerotignum sp.]